MSQNQNELPTQTSERGPWVSYELRRKFIRVAGTLLAATMFLAPDSQAGVTPVKSDHATEVISAAPELTSQDSNMPIDQRAEIASSLAEEFEKGEEKRSKESPINEARAADVVAGYSVQAHAGAEQLPEPSQEWRAIGGIATGHVTLIRPPEPQDY